MSSEPRKSIGPYRVKRRLGRGGMGEVFLAYDPRLDRRVAIKRIRVDSGVDIAHRARFQREARLAAGLLHPAIVQVFDLLTEDGVDHIVMEYVAGTSLRRALDDGGPLSPAAGLLVARAAAEGLAYARREGGVHRDLKSENVLLTPEGEAKIADFGIARRLLSGSGSSRDETLTRAGAIVGTYRSMSPEQACGDSVDARSDLFSLGVLLYEIFTGQSPFLAATNQETVRRILNHRPPSIGELVADTPPALAALIGHLLEKDPDLRPRVAEEVAQRLAALTEAIGGDDEATMTAGPTTVDSPTQPTEVSRSIRTLMLSDLVGSTDLVTRLGDRRAMELSTRHDTMARSLLPLHGGREIDKSDGFLLLFERPIEAVRYALGYHAALTELSERENVELSARVGIHLGEVFLRENPPEEVRHGAKTLEVEGLAKSVAARVANLADGGRTLLTRGAFDLAQRAAADEKVAERPLRWLSHGLYRFKGVEQPMEVCEVGIERRSRPRAPDAVEKAVPVSSGSGAYGKTLRRRWLGAAIVAAIAACVTLVRALWPPPPPRYIAVAAVDVVSIPSQESDEVAALAFSVRNAAQRGLAGLDRLFPINFSEVDSVSGSPQQVARAAGADELVASLVTCRRRECEVDLSRIQAADGAVIEYSQVPISIDDPVTAAQAVIVGLRQLFPAHRLRAGMGRFEVTPEDYADYLEIKRSFSLLRGAFSNHQILDRLGRIRESSASFIDAYLLEAEIAAREYRHTKEQGMSDRALELLRRAQNLAPGDPEVFSKQVYVEILLGHLDRAEAALADLEKLVPADVRIVDKRAYILEGRGEGARALELYRIAQERKPSWKRRFNYARWAYRLGEVAIARSKLEELGVDSPTESLGNRRARSLLAELEATVGDPSRAVEIYLDLGELTPLQLSNLGLAYMLLDRFKLAAATLQRAAAAAPADPMHLLNLGDVRWLQDRKPEARDLYQRGLELLDRQPAATSAQHLTMRAQALAHLGDRRQAVIAINRALDLQPDDGAVAFAAALVYAIVGDNTNALVYTERAIDLGFRNDNWFRLPWFAELKAGGELARIVPGVSDPA